MGSLMPRNDEDDEMPMWGTPNNLYSGLDDKPEEPMKKYTPSQSMESAMELVVIIAICVGAACLDAILS
jgi:hypothetical protein